MKPKYAELVKALDSLRQWVDASVLNACSPKEIRDSYSELCRASGRAEKLVKRAKLCSMRLSCHVRMFKPQFAPLVEAGTKCQTVRPTPKRMPKAGDRISLRIWTGKPYRSKQRVLREAEIIGVEKITLCDTGRELLVGLGNKSLTPEELNAFAAADGFKNGIELFNWFEATHGLPFDGVVIKWHNNQLSDGPAEPSK